MKKNLISGGILVVFAVILIVLGSRIKPEIKETGGFEEEVELPFKLGVVLPADETEGYTKEHMDAIITAAKTAGITEEEIVWKERTEEGDAKGAAEDLVEEDCTMVIAVCSCHAAEMAEFAEENPQVCTVAVTDTKLFSENENFYTAQLDTKEACYIAGVIAGMKLKEMHENGKIPKGNYQADGRVKIGYVAKYDEERSGTEYQEFLRGIRSEFSRVIMEIRFTGVRTDLDAEASAADTLVRSGCVMIGTNTESDRVLSVIERARENGSRVYAVGYHGSLPEDTSAEYTGIVKDWMQYYSGLFAAVAAEKEIPAVWEKGYADGAVTVLQDKKGMTEETKERIEKAAAIWEQIQK